MEKNYRQFIEMAPDAVVIINEEGLIESWNQQAEIMFGWTEKEVLGLELAQIIIPERYRQQHSRGLKHFLKTGEGPVLNKVIEVSSLKKNNDEFPVELKISPLMLEDKYMFIGFVRDISERKKVEEQFKKLITEIQEANQMKTEFLSNMSHELRTPLNSILILAKLLEENKNQRLSEKEIEYAKIIQKSGKDLLSLINDILDLNKIEAGKVDLVKEKVYFQQLAENMYDTFNHYVSSKNIQFKIEIAASLKEEYIYSDVIRLQQVLRNLLSNAFKFTGQGGKVTLRIAEEKNKDNLTKQSLLKVKRVISFSVLDTGIGIPDNQLKLIFDPFQQVDSSTSRKYGGTGLGLYITKGIVNLLEGEIKVRSKENEGSEFTVFFTDLNEQEDGRLKPTNDEIVTRSKPSVQVSGLKDEGHHIPDELEKEKKVTLSEIADLSSGSVNVLSGKTILLAEDDMRNVFSITAALDAYGIQIIHAGDGKEALQKLNEEQSIDMVLMDIMMPEMNGYEAMEEIRKRPEYKDLPIIALTAKAMKGDKEKCIEAGASDYISKPVDVGELLMMMAKHLVFFPFPMLILAL